MPNTTIKTIALLSLGILAFSGCDQAVDQPESLFLGDIDVAAGEHAVDAALAAEIGHQKVVPGFDLEIAKADPLLDLSWTDQGEGATYEVWTSTDPGFAPEDAGSTMIADGLTDASYSDDSWDGTSALYYRVRAVGGADPLSTTVGQITTTVYPGYTKLGVCLINDLENSADLIADFDSYPHSAHTWDAGSQQWDTAFSSDDPGVSFGVGEALSVFHNALPVIEDDTYTMVGQVPTFDDASVALQPGDNLVATLPLRFGELQASELLPQVQDATRIGLWDSATQTTTYYPDDGDFTIPACSPLHIEVTSVSDWPPAPAPAVECPCDLSVEGMLANGGLDGTNTCFEVQSPDVQVTLSQSSGLHGMGISASFGLCLVRNSMGAPIEQVASMPEDEFASCQADYDATLAALNPPPC